MEIDALGAAAAGAVPKLVELDRTIERSDVAKAVIEGLGKIHRAEATPAATRQEILDGFVACLEAKEHTAVIQASLELDALGAAAAGAVPKLVELGRTSKRSGVTKAAIEALGEIHHAEATLAGMRQEILDAKERAKDAETSVDLGSGGRRELRGPGI